MSTFITTNKSFAEWNEIFPNAACVLALDDRFVHHAEMARIKGKSYRHKEEQERVKARKAKRKPSKEAATCNHGKRQRDSALAWRSRWTTHGHQSRRGR